MRQSVMADLDLAKLEADGYIVVDGVLGTDAIGLLRKAFDDAPNESGTEHVKITADTPHSEAWSQLCIHSVVLDAARHLLHRPNFLAHGRNPRPGYGQQGLHSDSLPRQAGEPVHAVTAIWMLDRFTAQNGSTRVVPGTHVLPNGVPSRYAKPNAHHPEEIIVTGEAGAVLLFNGHLWHSGTKNSSTGPRRAVQMMSHAKQQAIPASDRCPTPPAPQTGLPLRSQPTECRDLRPWSDTWKRSSRS